MRAVLLAVVASALPLIAQDPESTAALQAGRERLEKALQRAATLTDTAFAAAWGPDRKRGNAQDPFGLLPGAGATGEVSGSWHPDLVHVKFAGDEQDEVLIAGRRMIARSKAAKWALRAGRFADGTEAPFVPDVALLLDQLARWQLALTHREVGMLDDRPVEVLSVTLNDDQVTETVWGGLLPPALTSGMPGAVVRLAFGGRGAGGRMAPTRPDATIDLAVTIDPATGVVHQLHFRAYANEGMAGRVVVMGGARGVGGNDEAEAEPEEEIDEDAPLVYVDGLPKRPRQKKVVNDFTVRLGPQGEAKAPKLDAAAKELLGL